MPAPGNLDLFDGFAQALGHNHRAVRICLRQNQNKFVATKTRRSVHAT